MKTKLTITVDPEVVPVAKRYARSRGVSLSSLIEGALKEMVGDEAPSFTERWRGQFRAASRDDPRYEALAGKYLADFRRSPIPAIAPRDALDTLF